MPHLGRPFPRLVEYWVPPGWFWPNFLPWRYLNSFRPAVSGIWSFLPVEDALLSLPGVSSSDRQTVSWETTFLDGLDHHKIVVTASYDRSDTFHELHWDALWTMNSVDQATAGASERFDLQATVPGAYTTAIDLTTGLPCDPPFIVTLEADYSTGGSPFPNPTGGPPPP